MFTPDPLAVGIPIDRDPTLIDMTASVTSNGILARRHTEGRHFPGQWAMTACGKPPDNPVVLFAAPRGTLLPTGGREHGHKGYNLALIIEALSQDSRATAAPIGRPHGAPPSASRSWIRLRLAAAAVSCARPASSPPPAVASRPLRAPRRCVPREQALARRLQARAAGIRLYRVIMEALAPWAERFDVVAPAPRTDVPEPASHARRP